VDGENAIELTERKMIKQVVLEGIPVTWNLDLKRANNHNCLTLTDLQKVLKPIEEAAAAKRKWNENKKIDDGGRGGRYQGNGNNQQGNGNNQNDNSDIGNTQRSGDKPCTKPGHRHKWRDCPDNRYGKNYQRHENNTTEQRTQQQDSSTEREVRFEDEHECNLMDGYLSKPDNNDNMPGLIERV